MYTKRCYSSVVSSVLLAVLVMSYIIPQLIALTSCKYIQITLANQSVLSEIILLW